MQSRSTLFDCQSQRLCDFTEAQPHLRTELLSYLHWTQVHLLKKKQVKVKEKKNRKFMKNNAKAEKI